MSANEIETTFQCGGIVCDARRLSEIDSGRIMVLVERDTIRRPTLRYGIAVPHPILSVGLGAVLMAFGALELIHVIDWMQNGGTLFDVELLGIAAAIIGVWLFASAFRRRIFLEIESSQGRKRLTFARATQWPAADAFIGMIERSYGIHVLRESPGAAVHTPE